MAWQPKHLTPAQLEERRMQGGRLLKGGRLSQAQIAEQLGVTKMSVSRWAAMLRHGSGLSPLKRRAHVGRPSKLTKRQWSQVAAMIRTGACASGFSTDRWTLSRVAYAIHQRFGVHFHTHYLAEPLRRLGFIPQLPRVQAKDMARK